MLELSVQTRVACPLPSLATRFEGAAGGVGGWAGPGPVMVTWLNTEVATTPSAWLVTARPTLRVAGMVKVTSPPTLVQLLASLE